MKIAIIGTGNVGSVLGRRWAEKGYEIVYGTRDPRSDKMAKLLEATGGRAKVLDLKSAVSECSVVVLAIPWPAAEKTIRSTGDLDGKIIVDCINPLAPDLSGLTIGLTTSAAEKVAEWTKGARVVKAFNSTGSKNMGNPVYGDQKASMFICGDDANAKNTVAGLAADLDFDVVDAGPLVSARYLEPLAMLWISLVYVSALGEDIAFKLLKR
jgi:NADPH-dependent F420 reductase